MVPSTAKSSLSLNLLTEISSFTFHSQHMVLTVVGEKAEQFNVHLEMLHECSPWVKARLEDFC
jgi:hypothetical protein